jgi:hypothetical protein
MYVHMYVCMCILMNVNQGPASPCHRVWFPPAGKVLDAYVCIYVCAYVCMYVYTYECESGSGLTVPPRVVSSCEEGFRCVCMYVCMCILMNVNHSPSSPCRRV